jgi:hypothetical protein
LTVLIVTNQQDYTADFLILELRKRSADYVLFNTEDFPQRVRVVWQIDDAGLEGHFLFPKARLDFRSIRSVWYRRPIPPVPAADIRDSAAYEFALAESQATIDGVLESLDGFWVSRPDNLRRAELKPYQLEVAGLIAFTLWPTLLSNDPDAARAFYHEQHGKAVYKPLRCGRLVRDEDGGLIYANPIGTAEADELSRVIYAPCLL